MRDERGSATVIGAFAIAALLSLSLAVTHVGMMIAAKHRVQGVADLAALAAAGHALEGETEACAAVVPVVRGFSVDECRLDGWDAVVTVSSVVQRRVVTASARAGPVGSQVP